MDGFYDGLAGHFAAEHSTHPVGYTIDAQFGQPQAGILIVVALSPHIAQLNRFKGCQVHILEITIF
jgi:hypothetical protein